MKQVSVETIFGTGTHHPCLSTLGREIATSGTVHSTQYPWIERDLQPEPEPAAAGKRRNDGCEWRAVDEHPSGSWSTIRIQDAEGRLCLGETCSFWPVLTRSGSTGGERLSCLGRLGGARVHGKRLQKLGASDRSCAGGLAGFHAAGHAVSVGTCYLAGGWRGARRGCLGGAE
jgi:hypothetical protein